MFGRKKQDKADFSSVKDLPPGVIKCMKCGETHGKRPAHVCGGPYNNIQIEEPRNNHSGMLKA